MGQFDLKQIRITATYGLSDFHDDLRDAMMTAAADGGGDADGGGECVTNFFFFVHWTTLMDFFFLCLPFFS
jgi:hypothetical protein